MKILIAADGSDHTRKTARHLAKHMDWFVNAEVHVFHVRPPLPYPGAAAALGRKAVEDYEREEARKALAVADKVLDKAGIAHVSSWVVGDTIDAIGRYVKKQDIDLVIVGSHGFGALKSLALGSTTTKLIATLDVPLLVIR